MTNDELEAVSARASAFRLGDDDAEFQRDMDRMRRFRPAEAKQLARLIEDMRVVVRTDIPALLDEVERLRGLVGELEFLRAEDEASFRNTEARATHAEAHAERLAGAIETMLVGAEGRGLFKGPSTEAARQALSAYRSAKDEACSRPADALDAPVQPTSSHLGNGVDQ